MRKLTEFLSSSAIASAAGYVLAGAESFLRHEAERAVLKAVFGGEDPGPGHVTIDGVREGGVVQELASVFDEAQTIPLFSAGKVVSVRQASSLVRANVDAFAQYLSERNAASVLLLHAETWDKRAAYAKKLDAFAVDCASLYETSFGESTVSAHSPLGRWVATRASEHRVALSAPAIVRVIELIGNNLAELDGVLERLGLGGTPSAEPLRPDDVDAAVAPSKSLSQFRVASLVTAGATREAFAAASTCFELGLSDEKGRVDHQESSVAMRLLWSIGREIEILYHARGLIDEKRYSKESAGSIGVPPFRADAVGKVARMHSLETLADALALALKAEMSLKSGEADPRFAAERLIVELGDVLSPALKEMG
jgi:DNA polymerase III delta subunit